MDSSAISKPASRRRAVKSRRVKMELLVNSRNGCRCSRSAAKKSTAPSMTTSSWTSTPSISSSHDSIGFVMLPLSPVVPEATNHVAYINMKSYTPSGYDDGMSDATDHNSTDTDAGEHEHHNHPLHHAHQFQRLFWIMAVIAVPVIAFSPMFASLLGYDLPAEGWTVWISPILGTVMYFWGGQPFLNGALGEIRSRQPGMMLLIGLAISVAFVRSEEHTSELQS